MVEKSNASAFFFCISEVPNPLLTKTFAMEVKIVTIATIPYASGSNNLASIIETINETPCAVNFSAKAQKKTAYRSVF